MSGSSPDAGFTPRKEFMKNLRTTNSFALLAIAGSNLIRLYSFPLPLITALRRLFDQQNLILGFREDVTLNFCEFSIDGKPWGSSKTVHTEKLLLDVLVVIYQHGYSFLSTIDYGREQDDRLAITFSKPCSPPPTPALSNSPLPASQKASNTNVAQKIVQRVPFALSFPSITMLRVINAPLHSTPAILQAVRGSWPRGVVSEKKVGDSTYEFKLKGYKWFQEDTFATDSLRHILSLLASLDAYSFSLLASISLSNRSRVKDLWIFTGPGPATLEQAELQLSDSPATSVTDSSAELRRAVPGATQEPSQQTSLPLVPGNRDGLQHRRFATAPAGGAPHPQPHPHPPAASPHTRAASDDAPRVFLPQTQHPPNHQPGHFLRKPIPRGQLAMDGTGSHDQGKQKQERVVLPSTVPSSVENMTGVGAVGRAEPGLDLIYETGSGSPLVAAPQVQANTSRSPSPSSRLSTSRTPPPSVPKSPGDSPSHDNVRSPPLLEAGVFDVDSGDRHSGLSSAEGDVTSCEIPITWTGAGQDEDERRDIAKNITPILEKHASAMGGRVSVGPMLPGGWTNDDDQPQSEVVSTEQDQTNPSEGPNATTPVHDVDARMASPEVTHPDDRARKSQAGLVVFPSQEALPLPPREDKDTVVPKEGSEGGGQGWVMVSVEGKSHTKGQSSDSSQSQKTATNGVSMAQANDDNASPTPPKQSSMSPAAKAIAIVDAVEASKPKSKWKDSGSSKDSRLATPSGIRRFFSKTKGNKPSISSADEATSESLEASTTEPAPEDPKSGGKEEEKPKANSSFRSKLKHLGVADA